MTDRRGFSGCPLGEKLSRTAAESAEKKKKTAERLSAFSAPLREKCSVVRPVQTSRRPRECTYTLLLFGATGDLAARQLFPCCWHLLRDRLLPEDFRIVAVARHADDDEAFRARLGERLAGIENGAEVRAELLRRTEYVAVDLSQPEAIAQTLRGYADGHRCVSYLATPPYLFVPIAQG